MSLELNLEIWEVLQEHIPDTKDAADDFVALLIEHGIDAEKIADNSMNEDIKNALIDYVDVTIDDGEEGEEEDDFEYSDSY